MNGRILPVGYQYAGVATGVKSVQGTRDLALITSDREATIAGVYTENLMAAAPVVVCRERTPTARGRVLVVNSGNANSCTGEQGISDALAMAAAAARAVGVDEDQSLVLSTGIIGQFLPMEKILAGIEQAHSQLAAGGDAFDAASQGILTTDNGPKTMSATVDCKAGSFQLAGMAKGAAMIGPSMATMLAVVLTDAALEADVAQQALKTAVDTSFNCISVEGHTSTNDSVLLIANGAAGADPLEGEDLDAFQQVLSEGCLELAKMIPDDGEGSTHLIRIEVRGTADDQSARQVAATVANSNLVKTGITGCDPNWGRIISAVGYAGVPLQTARLGLELNGIALFKNGAPVPFDEQQAADSMRRSREVHVQLELGDGPGRACFWTSDLTVDYVTFNSDYHT
jgi:glutamate N-acetyltransferase/amino-acid N-acetyltransferase